MVKYRIGMEYHWSDHEIQLEDLKRANELANRDPRTKGGSVLFLPLDEVDPLPQGKNGFAVVLESIDGNGMLDAIATASVRVHSWLKEIGVSARHQSSEFVTLFFAQRQPVHIGAEVEFLSWGPVVDARGAPGYIVSVDAVDDDEDIVDAEIIDEPGELGAADIDKYPDEREWNGDEDRQVVEDIASKGLIDKYLEG